MKVSELKEKFRLTLLTDTSFQDRDISGCYIGDLLSWVMGRAQAGNIWITIMSNINIAAVASLTGCACILLCENVAADEKVIQKANEEDIIILQSDKTAYELACMISGEI